MACAVSKRGAFPSAAGRCGTADADRSLQRTAALRAAKRSAAPLRVFAAACAARHPERRQKPCSAVRDGKYSAVFGFYRTES